ncbi:MAG: DUF4440 domain-containing protein [Anaerolineae bacterium]|nr:DUF4440 domain-containing protein [Gemmatimonadaceae bacterium]
MALRSAQMFALFAAAISPVMISAARASTANADRSNLVVAASPSVADTALRAEVKALNAAMVAAFNTDPSTVTRFYADSASIVGPRRTTVKGRAAIDRYWAGIRKPATWKLEVVEVGGSRAEAYQIGVSTLSSTGSNGQQGTYVCDFVVIWKRQPDGTLRIVLDLYN